LVSTFIHILFQSDNVPKNAAVCRFSLAIGFKFKLSNDVHFVTECIIFDAALNVVPSINNAVHFQRTCVVLPARLATLNHFVHNFIILIAFCILFANFAHLAALASILAPRKAHATIAHHTQAVHTATTTVIIISTKISQAILAFSSLRSQRPYHTISL
jgi:hypothetical protein